MNFRMSGKLTDNAGKTEEFKFTEQKLLSAKIDELRVRVNDRLTEYCNIEKAARGESASKKSKIEDPDKEIEEWTYKTVSYFEF